LKRESRDGIDPSPVRVNRVKAALPTIVSKDRERTFLGLVDVKAFQVAKTMIRELNDYVDYDDWLDVREGTQLGLAMAGVDSRLVTIDLSRFLRWCARVARQPSEAALDAFAAVIGPRSVRSDATLN
jgi:hypothetical protein